MSDYKPITGELRSAMCEWGWVERDGSIMFTTSPIPTSIDAEQSLVISGSDFDRLCDAIDAIHAQLERENAELKAKLDRVTGEQEEHTHVMGESITDELRAWAKEHLSRSSILAIADRIDAEHERECKEQYACGAEHGIGASIDASMIQTHGYVELPKDADGVPIRVGDKVTEHEDGYTFKVDGFMDWDGEWWVFMRDGVQAPASTCTHYHAPTVEDVLREFALKVAGEECMTIRTGVVEEYAAKLREVMRSEQAEE